MFKKWIILLLLLLFALVGTAFAEKPALLPELVNPSLVETDGEMMFILDGDRVKVYSLKDYRLDFSFGKRGEGPGEWVSSPDLPPTMRLHNGRVFITCFNKLLVFSKDGKLVREAKIPIPAFQVVPFGKKYAAVRFNRRDDGSSQAAVMLLDETLKPYKTLYEADLVNNFRKKKIAFPLLDTFIRSAGGKLYVFDKQKDFVIEVFDTDGKRLPPISHPYRRIRVTEAYKKEKLEWLKVHPAIKGVPFDIMKMLVFPEFLPVFRNVTVSGGKIYITTYRKKGKEFEFFIMDLQGKIQKRLFLHDAIEDAIRPNPAAVYAFTGNTYYYLVEDEEEEQWELHKKLLH